MAQITTVCSLFIPAEKATVDEPHSAINSTTTPAVSTVTSPALSSMTPKNHGSRPRQHYSRSKGFGFILAIRRVPVATRLQVFVWAVAILATHLDEGALIQFLSLITS